MLIVAVGVWLAIVVGNWASAAQHHARAKATLRSVLRELEQDEAEIREVLAAQQQNLQTVLTVAAVVREPAPEDSVIGRLITQTFKSNRTFFPRRAAYSIMVNAGQLEDPALLKMSNMCHRIQIFAIFYTRILEEQLKVVENTKRSVRAYLDGDTRQS